MSRREYETRDGRMVAIGKEIATDKPFVEIWRGEYDEANVTYFRCATVQDVKKHAPELTAEDVAWLTRQM